MIHKNCDSISANGGTMVSLVQQPGMIAYWKSVTIIKEQIVN
jgi:hypothetical protein